MKMCGYLEAPRVNRINLPIRFTGNIERFSVRTRADAFRFAADLNDVLHFPIRHVQHTGGAYVLVGSVQPISVGADGTGDAHCTQRFHKFCSPETSFHEPNLSNKPGTASRSGKVDRGGIEWPLSRHSLGLRTLKRSWYFNRQTYRTLSTASLSI